MHGTIERHLTPWTWEHYFRDCFHCIISTSMHLIFPQVLCLLGFLLSYASEIAQLLMLKYILMVFKMWGFWIENQAHSWFYLKPLHIHCRDIFSCFCQLPSVRDWLYHCGSSRLLNSFSAVYFRSYC